MATRRNAKRRKEWEINLDKIRKTRAWRICLYEMATQYPTAGYMSQQVKESK